MSMLYTSETATACHAASSGQMHCCCLQEGAKIFIRFNSLLPDNYEAVKAIAKRAVFRQRPSFADVLENAAATTGPGGHWDRALA